jgi:hypothetical protein
MMPALLAAIAIAGAPCPDLPMLPGTTWTYRARVSWTVEGSSSVRDTTLTWRTRVLGSMRRDSTLVATVENWPASLAWWEPGQRPDTTLLVCVNNQVFHLASTQARAGAGVGPSADSSGFNLTVDDLVFKFPLHEGTLYGQDPPDRGDTYYGWFVEAAADMPRPLVGLGANSRDSLYTIVYRTNPDHQILEFAPSLGITRYVYAHHGTVASAEAVLVEAHISH